MRASAPPPAAPMAGWTPLARPAATLASASFIQASYCSPPVGSAPRRSIVPEVELSTSAFTLSGWAMAYSSIVQPPIDWPTRRTSAKPR